MKTNSTLWLAAGLAAALVTVAGCSSSSDNGNGSGTNQGTASVPDSAGTTARSFIAYLMGLDPNDETSEPLLIKDSFAVPPDEGSDPQPLV